MTTNPPVPSLVQLALDEPLAVRLTRTADGSRVANEPLRVEDFGDIASEAWRDLCLRKGRPEVPLSEARMRLSPILAEGSATRCAGFKVALEIPGLEAATTVFSVHSLRRLADRALARLHASEVVRPGDRCIFEVVLDRAERSANPAAVNAPALTVSVRSAALRFIHVPLPALLKQATPVAIQDDDDPPVFYTKEAFARSEACARRGASAKVETGGALFGSLASCPETGEFFVIIRDVIGVEDADERTFSLSYTSRSWLRLQHIQRARQAALGGQADRLLGQTHAHPFLPNDGEMCAECSKRPTCTLTSAMCSTQDQEWHACVFLRQPWALCHIFGLTARGEPAHQLFGLRDGRLQSRGFYLLPEFPLTECMTSHEPFSEETSS